MRLVLPTCTDMALTFKKDPPTWPLYVRIFPILSIFLFKLKTDPHHSRLYLHIWPNQQICLDPVLSGIRFCINVFSCFSLLFYIFRIASLNCEISTYYQPVPLALTFKKDPPTWPLYCLITCSNVALVSVYKQRSIHIDRFIR